MASPPASLEVIFRPESIAVIGVSADKASRGRQWLEYLLPSYRGKLYAVGLRGGEVHGMKIYPFLRDIPGNVDYLISAIPAANMLQLIADAGGKGVKVIHIFSAGFSETGRQESADTEARVVAAARQAGIRILGPNCMGVYCPSTGLSFSTDFPMISGHVAMISQSGGNTQYAIREGTERKVYFSKAVSYGNGSDVNESDLLEYLTDDAETRIILAYIEGVRDGPRFRRVLTEAACRKPVAIYKSGMTEAGARAASSHTAAIAGSNAVWESLFKQTGALRVYGVEELIDMAQLFSDVAPPSGRKIGVIGTGGGAAVLSADECAAAGLVLPRFSPQTQAKINQIMVNDAGSSFKNPMDLARAITTEQIRSAVAAIMDSGEVDLLMIQIQINWLAGSPQRVAEFADCFVGLKDLLAGRAVATVHHMHDLSALQLGAKAAETFRQAGFPVFPSLERAAKAIARFCEYHERRQSGN